MRRGASLSWLCAENEVKWLNYGPQQPPASLTPNTNPFCCRAINIASAPLLNTLCLAAIFLKWPPSTCLRESWEVEQIWEAEGLSKKEKAVASERCQAEQRGERIIEYCAIVSWWRLSEWVRNPVVEARDTQSHANCYWWKAVGLTLHLLSPWLLYTHPLLKMQSCIPGWFKILCVLLIRLYIVEDRLHWISVQSFATFAFLIGLSHARNDTNAVYVHKKNTLLSQKVLTFAEQTRPNCLCGFLVVLWFPLPSKRLFGFGCKEMCHRPWARH